EPASGRASPNSAQQQQSELASAAAAALSQASRQRDDAEAEAEKRLDRFRKLLMYGRKREALEYASRRGLWGQALFLAHQMDAGLHARMLERFAARAMQPGDPLVALYHFMQGREPELADLRQWRPFLAMLLANRADRPRLAAAAVARLGDRLLAAGRLYASQLCHLLAGGCVALDDATDVDGDSFDAKSLDPFRPGGPIELIGFDSAAASVAASAGSASSVAAAVPNEAVQLTEVFEFAVGLRDRRRRLDGVCQRRLSARLLPYKFLYAVRLLDAGLSEEAFRYCRNVGRCLVQLDGSEEINKSSTHFESLMLEILRLAERLRCHPAVSEHLDTDWLAELAELAAGRRRWRQQQQILPHRPFQPPPTGNLHHDPASWRPPLPQQQQQQQPPVSWTQQQSSATPAAAASASSVHVAFDAFDEPASQIPDYQRRRALSSSASSHGGESSAVQGAGSGAHSRQTSPAPSSPPSSPVARPPYAPPPAPPPQPPPLLKSQPPPQHPVPPVSRGAARSRDSSLSSGMSHPQQQQQRQ
uniref:Sec16_C domain-containing protein n=1 Tax=Macrostomum lignano TaxID=282301 RepID=A0A1I8J8W9_9PLAT